MTRYKLMLDSTFCLLLVVYLLQVDTANGLVAPYLLHFLLYLSLTLLSFVLVRYQLGIRLLLIGFVWLVSVWYLPLMGLLLPFCTLALLLCGKKLEATWVWLALILTGIPFFFSGYSLIYAGISIFVGAFYWYLNRAAYVTADLVAENEEMRVKLDGFAAKLEAAETTGIRQAYLAKLEERNALSHQIHDQLGHSLTGGLMQLEAAKALLSTNQEKAAELLDNAILINKAGIEEIRKTLKTTKPAQESLAINRVKAQLEAFETQYGIRTIFQMQGELSKVTQAMWYVFIQNLTEGLTNVLKYSQASRVEVTLTILNKFVRMEMKDNGVGADSVTKSLGLTGMEERTAKLGGKLVIDSTDGFQIITLVPLETMKND
ncbi:sensor histidine kinase [Listeria booriae]|uniref:sensor histidine kinase n=1 Tax=Listeria booriae TaxID=1552123 RepID=UPI00162545D5|nr:sensor histidine kinase [Listeria booriae]MBC1271421.1 sensor histidine kinase [Listeria booriae]MBC1286081.1 sensor histidine kinase [Listeria booriae]